MYCPGEWHDATSRPHDLATMQQAWSNIFEKTQHQNLPYKLCFTGGEVTANKNFLPFIKWVRENYSQVKMILFTTNGSASLNYYRRVAQLVEAITFSTHSEFMIEDEFFKKVVDINSLMIRPEKSLHVNIMDEYWNADRIEVYKKHLDLHGISYSVNKIEYNLPGSRTTIMNKGKQNLVTV
jgi:organic radical activating enzyme